MNGPNRHVLIGHIEPGQTYRWRRTVTQADPRAMVRLTGDYSVRNGSGYHVDAEFARQAGFRGAIAPGLLQASLFTKLGGDLNYLARDIAFRYVKPVYAGDTLDVSLTVTAVEREKHRLSFEGQVTNQSGEVVVTCVSTGYLPRPEWGVPDKARQD